jgi:hypothetical protein
MCNLNCFSIIRGFSLMVISSLFLSSNVEAARITDGLVALYDLNEGSGTTLHDTSGFGAPLNLTAIAGHAGTRWNWIPGGIEIMEATSIESATAATKIADQLMSTDAITIEAWVQSSGPQGTNANPAEIVDMASGGFDNFSLFQIHSSDPQIGNAFGGHANFTDNRLIAPNSVTFQLQHVVYTRSGTPRRQNLFIDNDQKASGSTGGSFFLDPYPLSLANRVGADHPWLGQIHLVAIYDRVLSAAEIDQNFRAGPNPMIPALPGDYFDDSVVDAADYVVWRNNVGAPAGTLPNDNDGGVIGHAQYATWRANFGRTLAPLLPAVKEAVPEPAGQTLVVFASVIVGQFRRPKRVRPFNWTCTEKIQQTTQTKTYAQ